MTARPMRPKSPLGSGRAGAPTLMPARRALRSVNWSCRGKICEIELDAIGKEQA